MSVSCIIPTMNRYDTLKETLDSYVSARIVPDQLIVIDQTTDVQQRKRIESLVYSYSGRFKEVIYRFQSVPSLTRARNAGYRLAKHELILCSDDDITVEVDTVENVEKVMCDTNISMLAGIDSNSTFSRSKVGYLFGKKSYSNRNIGHVTKAMFGRFPQKPVNGLIDTQWAMGFFFVIRKELMDEWNLSWDEKLTSYAYAEDLDFSYSYYKKSKQKGVRCVLSDRVIVKHRVSTEYRTPSRKATMMYVINREYLSYKHGMGLDSRLLTRWSNFGDFVLRLLSNRRAIDLFWAQIICDKHRKDLKKGLIESTWYDE